jgi:hypothetical protein
VDFREGDYVVYPDFVQQTGNVFLYLRTQNSLKCSIKRVQDGSERIATLRFLRKASDEEVARAIAKKFKMANGGQK